METAAQTDRIRAFNARAKAAGWTVTCAPARGFQRPELAQALAVWREKAGDRPMPTRAEMTARALKPFLTQMSLLERVCAGETARYRVRLHGTALAGYAGDRTGRYLDEVLPPELVGGNVGIYDTALELQLPLRVVSFYQSPEVDYLAGESLVAPLTLNGSDASLILSVTYAEARCRTALKP